MNVSKTKFASLYNENRISLTGARASDREIEENYRYYAALVDLSGRDGELLFKPHENGGMTWEFLPRAKLPA